MTWKAIINEGASRPFEEKISQFAHILKEKSNGKTGIGLLSGRMGIVLFLYYYSLYSGQNEFKDIGFELIEGIFDQIETSEVPHTFCEGLAGFGWGLNHLIAQGFIEADLDELFVDLDQFSSQVVGRYIEDGNFDFLQGAVGIGLYLLDRYPRQTAADSLSALLDALERHAVSGPNGTIHWQTVLDPSDGSKGCNLSLSHGMSGIANLLTRMATIEAFNQRATSLITGACRYLLERQFDNPGQNSMFPSFFSQKYPPTYSRLAWCYGDLGIAIGFSHAARATGDDRWHDMAKKIFTHSATRQEPQHTGVNDACVCHGSAGNAHIFNRAFQTYGNETFREAAIYWLNDSLLHARYPDGYAGYKMRHPEIKGGWQPEADLLEGIAGIGLVFIAAVSAIEPAWDQSLMIG